MHDLRPIRTAQADIGQLRIAVAAVVYLQGRPPVIKPQQAGLQRVFERGLARGLDEHRHGITQHELHAGACGTALGSSSTTTR